MNGLETSSDIFELIASYAPVVIPNSKLQGRGIGVFKLPKGTNKILVVSRWGGGGIKFSWGIETVESYEDFLLNFEEGYDIKKEKYKGYHLKLVDAGEIRNIFNSCKMYGVYERSGPYARNKTQPGFIEIK